MAYINDALAAGDLEFARVLVDRLKQHTVGTLGATHPYTLEAYAVDAYIAYLERDEGRATAVSLHVARLRHEQGDLRARQDVLRAAATWNLIDDPRTALPLGRELLAVWEQSATQGVPDSTDDQARRQAETRLRSLARYPHPADTPASA
ncbi:hypothetical protein [Streptomyces sp. AK02-01A]|uniref:hypothetical protein n=1 Tax=Streptomyces sp. AK02-01A TaxID=3028648 RepID=UPI0029B61333|nr:hypothetical protein [Streptomyces sp. AK02-01A]MDX3850997.1 hypothetical protein [Streptomyces sp. AK02-01A]